MSFATNNAISAAKSVTAFDEPSVRRFEALRRTAAISLAAGNAGPQ